MPLVFFFFFFFIVTAPSVIYTLSLHDALPISMLEFQLSAALRADVALMHLCDIRCLLHIEVARSEEHTSELQSRFDLVCRLLLEKKNHDTTEDNVDPAFITANNTTVTCINDAK